MAREVVATYIVNEVDNVSMEITIQLPTNYPLGVIAVKSDHKGIAINKWRRWMYQLNTFLMHQVIYYFCSFTYLLVLAFGD